MAKKVRMTPVVDMTQVITATEQSSDVTLSGKSQKLVSSLLRYASSHGPAIYGTKETRYNIPAYDTVIRDTLDAIDHPVQAYTTFDKIISDESEEKTITLDGKQARLVRGLLSHAQSKGMNLLGVKDEEKDAFDALVSGVLSDLS